MVYKWTMSMQFSFEYCIDPKDHKSEEDIKAIAVEGAMVNTVLSYLFTFYHDH